MQRTDTQVVRVTTGIAAAFAAFIAIGFPLAWFQFDYRYESGRMESQLEMQAYLIGQIAARNPELWQFEAARLEPILNDTLAHRHLNRHDVIGAKGEIVVIGAKGEIVARSTSLGELPAPTMSHSVPIFESGRVAGAVRGEFSIRDMVFKSAEIAAFCLLMSVMAFVGLRMLPLRVMRNALQRATYLANHDALTGLPNRSLFGDRLGQAVAGMDRTDDKAAVVFLDLDHFKEVNDMLGHAAGDVLLIQVVDRIGKCLRKTDTLARLGGDEFAIIQNNLKQPESAAIIAQRIIEKLQPSFCLNGHDVVIGCSMGIAFLDSRDPQEVMRKADLALYRAKAEGRGIYRFFEEEMNRRLLERKTLEWELRRALVEDQFSLLYQPQVELKSGNLAGVEALLRWHHPTRGLVGPGEFIWICEETGLIGPIGEWVLRRACRETQNWRHVKVAVNISPAQFRQSGLASMVARVLEESGFDPKRLELEITEAVLIEETDIALSTLRAIKELGVQVAMDDFGTGYSSLSFLRRFPFDKVKIDQSFVRDLGRSADATAIVRAVIALSHSLGMQATAEGVETAEQAQLLLEEGCQEAQGFLFSRPVPADELAGKLNLDELARGPVKVRRTA